MWNLKHLNGAKIKNSSCFTWRYKIHNWRNAEAAHNISREHSAQNFHGTIWIVATATQRIVLPQWGISIFRYYFRVELVSQPLFWEVGLFASGCCAESRWHMQIWFLCCCSRVVRKRIDCNIGSTLSFARQKRKWSRKHQRRRWNWILIA